jgi:hypothetical protein
VKESAILLRRRHRLTIPDAIIAATAQSLDSELLTNDAKLLAIPDITSRSLALKANRIFRTVTNREQSRRGYAPKA